MAGKHKKGRFIFYPNKMGSKTCGDLVTALRESQDERKTFRVHPDRRFRSRSNDIIINWGNSTVPNWDYSSILNSPESVAIATNKLSTLRALEAAHVSHVPFTTDISDTLGWDRVVCRHKLSGHSGDGIEIVDGAAQVRAPLYTQFIPKSVEFRVHVFNGLVIDYTKKIKRVDGEVKSRVKDDLIRSNTLGWEYIRDVEPRESVKQLAIQAIHALGLDFGAVDIIRSNRVNYVLEINTACGLSGVGLKAYADAIIDLI